MIGALGAVAAATLRRLDPERAHDLAVRMLQAVPRGAAIRDDPSLAVEAFGLRFANPVGLAAGFDKDARAGDRAGAIGFGHVEVGTLTPLAQAGNPRPRVFRLAADAAVINRYGFNNAGHAAALGRLAGRRARLCPVGVNIGANKEATDRTADYVAGIATFAAVADYFTLNVSSPNTPGLRDLQATAALDDLLARCLAARDAAAERHGRRSLLLKIAPDLDLGALDAIVGVARRRGIDGMIVSNTTVARPADLQDPAAGETGGLSGRPLFARSTRMLAATWLRIEGAFPLVGVGGIDSPAAAWSKIEAGATLVQLYTGLVYAGPGLVADIKRDMAGRLRAAPGGWRHVVGSAAAAWAAGD